MLERGRLVYTVPGTLGVIGGIVPDGANTMPTYLLVSTEIDPSNLVPVTNVTFHLDQDEYGAGTYVQDVVTAVTLVPGGSLMLKVPNPAAYSLQFRAVTASGKAWQVYVEPLTRYSGVQRG